MFSDVQTESSVGGQSHNATGDLQTQRPLLLKSIDDKKEFPKETQMVITMILKRIKFFFIKSVKSLYLGSVYSSISRWFKGLAMLHKISQVFTP